MTGRTQAPPSHPGAARAWIAWWVLLQGLYLALVDTISVPELITGAVSAAVAATGAVLVRRERQVILRPRAAWARGAVRPLAGSVGDLRILVAVLWRRGVRGRDETGRLVRMPYDAVGHDPEAAAHRVLTQALGSIAPNTIVLGIDADRHELLAHQLAPRDGAGSAARPLGPG